MGLKSVLVRPLAWLIAQRVKKWSKNPHQTQQKVFENLVKKGTKTRFGKDFEFHKIKSYEDFKKQVPIADYEDLKPYIEKIKSGEKDVLWPGKPIYFAKTSGTTSGVKYIPITKDSVPYHVNSARDSVFLYAYQTGNYKFIDGKLIFLSGSPELENVNGILTGRLSGIVNHHVPSIAKANQVPSWKTNCIEDWEEKVNAIVEETLPLNMTLISGIPAWVMMYFEKLIEKSGKKTISEIFPNFSVFVYGGVNFEPYRAKMEKLIGKRVDSIETYPASEGFIAYQDTQTEDGLLLLLDNGIFYEFIPSDEYFNENPTRISLKDVELEKNYALILNTNAGLWGYSIGDTVKFVSKNPYRIEVTGRIKHFISAFGEHVIGEEVEWAMLEALKNHDAEIVEFHVAPQVTPPDGELPYHEWFVEFAKLPSDLDAFRKSIDTALQSKNIYYKDLLEGNILQPLKITQVQPDAFRNYMKSQGKLGGQNKVPRLGNDRSLADKLMLL